jgi:hypothetical protein
MYALAGYSELFLADLYCSGVPLSTLDALGDFTYQPGSKTQDLYYAAIAQFDSALSMSHDSTRFVYFAQIGKGRAYLALGQYDAAAVAVQGVPTDYTYQFAVNWRPNPLPGGVFGGVFGGGIYGTGSGGYTVADRQGNLGLPYRSSDDPRTASEVWGSNSFGVAQYAPVADGGAALALTSVIAPITVANGIEARLIEAEAALKHGNASWLTILNTLRTNGASTTIPAQTLIDTLGKTHCGGTYGTCGTSPGGSTPEFGQPVGGFPGYTMVAADTTYPAPPGFAGTNGSCWANSWYTPCYDDSLLVVLTLVKPAATVWSAGMGGVNGLAPLTDPGASPGDTARIRLLFAERAYWLFLTGHRQGDLRRLMRNYGLAQSAVYPTGAYPLTGAFGRFGSDVTAPIPANERVNPRFSGCLSRGA